MLKWPALALALLDQGQAVVLCSVVRTQGSTPRAAGTQMLISATQQHFTIGGGHLEWQAIHHARALLANRRAQDWDWQRYALGPSLGQCCGGVVELLFEVLGPQDVHWLTQLTRSQTQQIAIRRQVHLTNGAPKHICCLAPDGQEPLWSQNSSGWQWEQDIAPADWQIYLFGSGHVGQALIHILSTLPCQVHWIDERETSFPTALADNIIVEATDIPEALIEQAPDNSYFLIMTHNHDLDLRLCHHILKHARSAYLGVIGSRTKQQKFIKRLLLQGCTPEQTQQLICPMGLPNIEGKDPAIIAVAVIAQILEHAQTLGLLCKQKDEGQNRHTQGLIHA